MEDITFKVYLVIREGQYRHEILGIYHDQEIARQSADFANRHEKDEYHEIVLAEAAFDEPIQDVTVLETRYRSDTVIAQGGGFERTWGIR